MSAESEIQARILLALGARPDVRLFRNTVGEGWQGQVKARNSGTAILRPGDVVLRNARYVTFGLAPGSCDLVGWHSVTISQADVGCTVAQFMGIEVKAETGRISKEQQNFIAAVRRAGGCADIAKSPDAAAKILEAQWRHVSD